MSRLGFTITACIATKLQPICLKVEAHLSVKLPTMANNVKQLRLYYGPLDLIWNLLQIYYARHVDDSSKAYTVKHVFFCNSLFTVLAQVEGFPEGRKVLLQSLISYIHRKKIADGLESILLTLIYSSFVDEDVDLSASATKVWVKFAAKATVSGAGPLVFYNVSTKRLSFFSTKTAAELRISGFISTPQSMAQELETRAINALKDPYHTPSKDMKWIVESESHTDSSQKGADVKKTLERTAKVLKGIAFISAFIPGGQGVAWVAGGISVGIDLGIVAGEVVVEARQPTSQLESEDLPPDPGDIPDPGDFPDPGDQEVVFADNTLGTSQGPEAGDGGDGDGGDGCFPADTPVSMFDGSLKPIADIRDCELVMGQHGAEAIPCKVTRVHRFTAPETLRLRLSNEASVVTTPRQQFSIFGRASDDRTFVEARNLTPGLQLSTLEAHELKFAETETERVGCEVFNLTVERAHTYFIGLDRILVHNRKMGEPGPEDPEVPA
ncbi:hypothetical protein V500_00598 [Pseudogymnoascus sp. VKM F-4518 (FW-2643)]|nr:hypothetical protein V500_00598 [Pseudogymnoascus sp. VKM F-4518 (FW-2643)]